MTCDEARKEIDALLDGELDGTAVRDHVSACPACARVADERRVLSAALSRSFEHALEGVEPAPEDRRRVVERLTAEPARRARFVGALAAAAVIGLAVGLVTTVLAGPSPEQMALAERMREAEAKGEQIRRVSDAVAGDLEFVDLTFAGRPDTSPAARALCVGLWNTSDRLQPGGMPADIARLLHRTADPVYRARSVARASLRRLGVGALDTLRRAVSEAGRFDRRFVDELVSDLEGRVRSGRVSKVDISRVGGGVEIRLTQWGDGRVRLVVPDGTFEAANMDELLGDHPGVCRKYAVAGRDGRVSVGGSGAAVDLQDRIRLLFRTGAWDDEIQWDAYRSWIARRVRDAREIERRVREFRDQVVEAARPGALPVVEIDLNSIMESVRELEGDALRRMRERMAERLRGLDARLDELRALHARARGLRLFAERVRNEE